MLKKIPDIPIPVYNKDNTIGGSDGYDGSYWRNNSKYTVYENCIFEDSIRMTKFAKTHSSAPYVKAESLVTKRVYTIRWMQLKDILFNCDITKGVIDGIFTFDLKWNHYSLAIVDPTLLPQLLSQYELKDPWWWKDQPVIRNDHLYDRD